MPDPIPSGLAPCPFCGGSEIFVERVDYSSCYVICNDCSARGPVSCDENDADAEASENDFVDPGELPARRLWNQRAFLIERLTSAPVGEQRAREIARMREVAKDWRRPALAQVEGPNDLKIYGGTIADDIDRWADLLSTAPSPSPVARVPDRDEIAAELEAAFRSGRAATDGSVWLSAADRILALFTAAASDGWHLVETAPHACHVLAARFDGDEWAMAVVSSPPSKPFTHWRLLPKPPSSSSETSGDDVGGGR